MKPQQGDDLDRYSDWSSMLYSKSKPSLSLSSDWVMAASNENEMKEWIEAFKVR